jgi:hypothetical protein
MSSTIVNGGEYEEPLERLKRIEEQYRRLGTRAPICAWPGCGESNSFALVGRHPDISCYEHHLLRAGGKPYEAHHVAGQANSDVTADVPGNDHRVLSALQAFWPEDTLRNPEHSPLLAAAAAIRGWCDVMQVVIDRSIGWIPGFLEWLNNILVDVIGVDWWVKFEWSGAHGGV